jgi:hypothetical protein
MSNASNVRRIVLGDHARLPGRFFGRLTASSRPRFERHALIAAADAAHAFQYF